MRLLLLSVVVLYIIIIEYFDNHEFLSSKQATVLPGWFLYISLMLKALETVGLHNFEGTICPSVILHEKLIIHDCLSVEWIEIPNAPMAACLQEHRIQGFSSRPL